MSCFRCILKGAYLSKLLIFILLTVAGGLAIGVGQHQAQAAQLQADSPSAGQEPYVPPSFDIETAPGDVTPRATSNRPQSAASSAHARI